MKSFAIFPLFYFLSLLFFFWYTLYISSIFIIRSHSYLHITRLQWYIILIIIDIRNLPPCAVYTIHSFHVKWKTPVFCIRILKTNLARSHVHRNTVWHPADIIKSFLFLAINLLLWVIVIIRMATTKASA